MGGGLFGLGEGVTPNSQGLINYLNPSSGGGTNFGLLSVPISAFNPSANAYTTANPTATATNNSGPFSINIGNEIAGPGGSAASASLFGDLFGGGGGAKGGAGGSNINDITQNNTLVPPSFGVEQGIAENFSPLPITPLSAVENTIVGGAGVPSPQMSYSAMLGSPMPSAQPSAISPILAALGQQRGQEGNNNGGGLFVGGGDNSGPPS